MLRCRDFEAVQTLQERKLPPMEELADIAASRLEYGLAFELLNDNKTTTVTGPTGGYHEKLSAQLMPARCTRCGNSTPGACRLCGGSAKLPAGRLLPCAQ